MNILVARNDLGISLSLAYWPRNSRSIDSPNNVYVEKFFNKNLPDLSVLQCGPIYHAVNMIIWKKSMIRVRDLAASFCMSERMLNRQFLLKVGLSRKAYAKIWQWQYVTQLLQTRPNIGLEELAFKTGYFDVSHLAHDFKNKILQTPSEYRQAINPLIKNYLNFPAPVK